MVEFTAYVKSLKNILEILNIDNPSALILPSNFNVRSLLFWEGDDGTREGDIFNRFLISNIPKHWKIHQRALDPNVALISSAQTNPVFL